MKPCLTFLSFLLLMFPLPLHASGDSVDSLMSILEEVLENRDTYIRTREDRISDLRKRLSEASDDETRYELIGNLHDTYKPFNTDSAYYYSLQREQVARRLGDPQRILNARMNRASTLQAVGMYKEVADIMQDIRSEDLPDYLLPHYYYIMRTMKGNMADFSAFAPIRAQYIAQTRAYRDSIIGVNEPGSLARMVSIADQHNSFGEYEKAVRVMNEFMATHDLSDHEKAICAWTLADSYAHLGRTEDLKRELIVSSIGDMKGAVREYVSLRELAMLLYKEGDLERAYRFMNIAIDDARKCNARQRLVELSEFYPTVTGIYVEKIKSQRRSLQVALWIIGVLAAGLVLALVYVWRQMRVIARSRAELKGTNERLNDANARLNEANFRLNESNTRLNELNGNLNEANAQLLQKNCELERAYREIEENSRLKEAYIGRYMDECVAQIDAMDSFRKGLLKLTASGKQAELKAQLKSTDQIDLCLKNFYDGFDRTFLSLFPTFVEDFNALLLPGEAIVPKREGSLNTELRIFALIRLGITDSDKIARFLRYSVTTIYNYRTKVRNKARGERSALEEAVRSL